MYGCHGQRNSPCQRGKETRWRGGFFDPGEIYTYCTCLRNRITRSRRAQLGLVRFSPQERFKPTTADRSKIVRLCKRLISYYWLRQECKFPGSIIHSNRSKQFITSRLPSSPLFWNTNLIKTLSYKFEVDNRYHLFSLLEHELIEFISFVNTLKRSQEDFCIPL